MTKNCFNNPIVRDGTSQQMRLIKSLLPDYVSVDERGFDELKQFVLEFSKELQFYNVTDERSGDWYSFFNQKIQKDQKTEPHYALFQAFLELFSIAQTDLNTLTKRHLDFYFKDVLRLKEKSPVSDQVFVIFELAKHVSENGSLIRKGTRLKAGSDALGNNVFYTTTQDIVINQAQVVELKGLFKDNDTSRIYNSPIANSSDGFGAEIETDTQSWPPFGNTSSENRDNLAAKIGFSFASPILNLSEGTRTVKMLLNFEDINQQQIDVLNKFTSRQLNEMFEVYFSGEEDWISPSGAEEVSEDELENTVEKRIIDFLNRAEKWEDIAGVEPEDGPVYDSPFSGYGDQVEDYDIGEMVANRMIEERDKLPDREFTSLEQVRAVKGIGEDKMNDLRFSFRDNYQETIFNFANKTLCITRTISRDQEPIVGYNEKALKDPINTTLPVAKILLNIDPNLPYAYDSLIDLQLTEARIIVDVSEIKNLIVQNDQTVMDPAKTIQPFGIIPVLGANFYVGNQEVFQKKLSHLKVNFNWYGLPTEPVDQVYVVTPGTDSVAPVTATRRLYGFDGHYSEFINPRKNTSFKTRVSILDKKSWVDLGENINLFSDTDNTQLESERSLEFGTDTIINSIERDVELESFRDLDTSTKKGFIRFELTGADFGHKDFSPSFTKKVLESLKVLNNPAFALPKEPYTPVIESITLDYKSEVCLKFKSDNRAGCSEEQQNVEQFFQMAPFGASEVGIEHLKNSYFIPQFRNEGEFYIGLEKLSPPQNISLLFQLLEGSESPDIEKPTVIWEYLSDNEWIRFEQFDILSDTTNGLIRSGLVNLAVPKKATDGNSLLKSGYHWIRFTVDKGGSAIPQFIRVVSQAVVAEFENNNNDPEYLAQALAAESIAKLEFSDSSVKKLNQPFASFGGKVKEQSTAFYKRVSERLRHKQRAITIWDYERLVLEEFPSAYKVKCLNHTKFSGKRESFSDIAPGNVSLIVVSNVLNRNAVDPIRPLTSLDTLDQIKTYLNKFRAPAFDLHIQNPIYEGIEVRFKVKFRQGFDIGFYKRKLEDEIKGFLAPWAYADSPDIVFGAKIHQSMILNFVDERAYVDFVTCFKMYHTEASPDPVTEALATTSASILTSVGEVSTYGDHKIEVIETDINCDQICDDNQIDPPPPILSVDTCCDDDTDNDPDEDLFDYSKPDLELCPEPEQRDDCEEEKATDCVLEKQSDPNNYEPFKDGFILKKTNVVYFIPKSQQIAVNIDVTGIINKRTIKIAGDWSDQTYKKLENPYDLTANSYVYEILTNSADDQSTFNGDDTVVSFSNRDHEIEVGDKINLFNPPSNDFNSVYLPKVDVQMVENEETISIQILASSGENLQIRRSEKEGLDRLQKFKSEKTDASNIALETGAGLKLFSIKIQATQFDPKSGYNNFGWRVVAENENYYFNCIENGAELKWENEPFFTKTKCVLTDADNNEYFESDRRKTNDDDNDQDVIIKQVDTTYLLPLSYYRTVRVAVKEIISKRILHIAADITNHTQGSQRIENVFRIDKEPEVLDISSVSIIDDGVTKVTVKSNINDKLKKGDFVNVFRKRGEQFSRVYLPEVTQQMVDESSELRIMIVTADKQSIEINRSETNGKGRLQPLDSGSTTNHDIRLDEDNYSIGLIAKKFNSKKGYSEFGWQVTEENSNYFRQCIDENEDLHWDNRYDKPPDDDEDDD